jgi:mono/diheme cytochrome c family protein
MNQLIGAEFANPRPRFAAVLAVGLAFFFWAGIPAYSQTKADAPAPPKSNTQSKLARKAYEILKANCHRCHGKDGENEGGLNYVLDLKTLVSRKKVVPGNPDASVLIARVMADKRSMPPKSEKVRPSAADIAVLRKWIEGGAVAIDSGEAPRPFLADTDVVQFIREDLLKIEARYRRFARYFTIAHLYNAGRSDDELQTYRLGLSKLVNSLSWEREIEVPRPVDPARTIFRIDLRYYQWSPELWNRILADYPYGLVQSTAAARDVLAATETALPWVSPLPKYLPF